MSKRETSSCAGLILSGGGARAAYQVGVLKAVAEILPADVHNPFPVICGTSAGALNATVVATHAARFREGIDAMEEVWSNFTASQVYRTQRRSLMGRASRWLSALFMGGVGAHRPVSLLDNSPLAELLGSMLRFQNIEQAIADGDLRALSITCSGYTSGQSVSFYQGVSEIQDWGRARRKGRRTRLGLQHLMASSAIPVVFPAVRIGEAYYGDGSVRQLAPISPALHMGADRVLVVGVSGNLSAGPGAEPPTRYPTVAEILGHMLDSAFIDSLEGDLERLERINRTLRALPEKVRDKAGIELRPIKTLIISPSQDLDLIAARHAKELPRSIRFFLRGSGADEGSGATVASYLLFEAGFCRELIALGYKDAWRRESEILRFLGIDPARAFGTAAAIPADVW
ncbi:MAG: patatin-like phospholipase family protein [Ectothiorhodospiraceae bacterium]|nr:patatin-like phospholipase family protein [Ectothiorhodospiraceae bacterium]MCH8505091.1 patatin-like phospholipase family protein [Ectothiorhodospiraceae bacterium]